MTTRMFDRLRQEVKDTRQKQRELASLTERSEYSGAVVAFALAAAPTTGVGDNLSYTSVAWISDGRKPGEGGGAGTGVLAWFNAVDSTWYSVFDQLAVAT